MYGYTQWDSLKLDDANRHSDGGNYLLADGHVKWFKVTFNDTQKVTQNVFYPAAKETSTSSAQGTANANQTAGTVGTGCSANYEPQPGGNMCGYAATFHLN
jgi:prepilin-type processing-associated H-X9-DG protein